jgi:hypothetical protein
MSFGRGEPGIEEKRTVQPVLLSYVDGWALVLMFVSCSVTFGAAAAAIYTP